jgi:nitroreductase
MNPSALTFTDPPRDFPVTQVNGDPLKPLTEVLLERRATSHFKPDPVPERYLEAILQFALQAPSGYNLQPWRFLVVRNPAARRRLQTVAMDQPKVGQAPVVIIAFAVHDEWRSTMDPTLQEGARRGLGTPEAIPELKSTITAFLNDMPSSPWLNRHTMIAVTTLMLAAEAYGLNTAPMEGFDPAGVKREFGLPDKAEVVALLALGFADLPPKKYGGRFSMENVVHLDHYGRPWANGSINSPEDLRASSGTAPAQ